MTSRDTPNRQFLDPDGPHSLEDACESVVETSNRYEADNAAYLDAIHADGTLTYLRMFFISAIARARALHEAIGREISERNPHAACVLLRQFAESIAVILYLQDHPAYVQVVAEKSDDSPAWVRRVSTSELIDHAKEYMPSFDTAFSELSEIADFGSIAFWASFDTDGDAKTFSWSSATNWKTERQGRIACAQALELSDAMQEALDRLGAACLCEPIPRQ